MIHAFAGDNLTSDVVACGVAVFQEDRVAAAEELLRIEKVAVGIPADERLHCRVMFSDHGRNAAGIPGPRARGPWAASSIRAMIFNPLYRGELVWGWTRWADQGGTKRKLDVSDMHAWLTVPAPALRIIDEQLWKATHERLAQGRAVYMARTGGQSWGRPLNPTESKYLLTGLLRCKHCGGGLHVSKQSGRRGQGLWLYYVCAHQRTRGIPPKKGGK
jgi:hypothetical protein